MIQVDPNRGLSWEVSLTYLRASHVSGGSPRLPLRWPEKEPPGPESSALVLVRRLRRALRQREQERRQRAARLRLGAATAGLVLGTVGAFPTGLPDRHPQASGSPGTLPPPVPAHQAQVPYVLIWHQGWEGAPGEAPPALRRPAVDPSAFATSVFLAPAGYTLGLEVQGLIRRSFPSSQWAKALRVAYCESRFDPGAVGDNGRARGVFQFHRETFLGTPTGATHGWDAALSAEVNVRAAAEKVARDGWSAWTCQ